MITEKIPVIVIFAPTATGKTALTEHLFGDGSHSFFKDGIKQTPLEKFNAEIISADSMAVYKYMNIGTAKPDENLLKKIPHHMIDLVTPDVQFSVSDFVTKADEYCKEIYERGNIPVVCGGTGFYIRNFLLGLPDTPESNPEIRNNLKRELEKSGIDFMYEKLKLIDPLSAEKINKNDAYRILRALEVFYLTGKPRSSFELSNKLRDKFNFITVILERDRKELYERIDLRIEQMFKEGLKEEVDGLIKMGYKKENPGMQAIGYREFFMNLDSDEAIKEKIKSDSHAYAKKQYVFMKEIPGARTFNLNETDSIQDLCRELSLYFCQSILS